MKKTVLGLIGRLGAVWVKKEIGLATRLTLTLVTVQAILAFLAFFFLPPEIPLFYANTWGEAQLAPSSFIFLLPFLGFVLWLVDALLASLFINEEQFLSQVLIWSALAAVVLLLITQLGILWVVC